MTNIKTFCFGVISSILLVASIAHADTAIYTLDDMLLESGEPITGTFVWTFAADDFEGGSGEFTALEIPYTAYSLADDNLNIDIQSGSIEISGNGNYHDAGLDITIVLSQPLSLTQPAPIDLGMSFFECCGNGFQDQFFQSGSISPASNPGVELAGLTTMGASCRDQTSGERKRFRLSGATSWSCGDAGIFPQGGDIVQLVTVGTADGLLPVVATLTDVTPLMAKCINLTTRTMVHVSLAGNPTVDCAAEGLAVAVGDRVSIIGMGLVGDF